MYITIFIKFKLTLLNVDNLTPDYKIEKIIIQFLFWAYIISL